MQQRQGFTLLEILVVVMIITILATIVAVRVIPELGKANVSKAVAQITNFQTALNLYRLDNKRFPTQAQGLQALCEQPTRPPIPDNYRTGGYLESPVLPRDPWDGEYVYIVPGSKGADYEIISYGADGEPGGEDENADISSLVL